MNLKAYFILNILLVGLAFWGGTSVVDADSLQVPALQSAAAPAIKGYNYTFAVHPLYNPDKLFKVFQPLVTYLNQQIPELKLKLIASRDYAAFEQKLYKGEFDFALPNPYQTLQSLKYGYQVFGKMGDDKFFTGIILLRKDSSIRTFEDLKGKTIAYPSETALAACMMPQYYLYEHGININKDVTNIFVGSQESSILSVLTGSSQAAATWPIPWQGFQKNYPDKASQLFVKWQTAPMINNGLICKAGIPDNLVHKLSMVMCSLQNTKEGKQLLESIGISRFETADDKTYLRIRAFLDKFSRDVRPVNY